MTPSQSATETGLIAALALFLRDNLVRVRKIDYRCTRQSPNTWKPLRASPVHLVIGQNSHMFKLTQLPGLVELLLKSQSLRVALANALSIVEQRVPAKS